MVTKLANGFVTPKMMLGASVHELFFRCTHRIQPLIWTFIDFMVDDIFQFSYGSKGNLELFSQMGAYLLTSDGS